MPPILNNELLDDPLGFDLTADWSGGVNSRVAPFLLAANASSRCQNLDLINATLLQTRRGTLSLGSTTGTEKIQGLAYFDTPTIEQLFSFKNGVARYWNGLVWTDASGFSPDASALIECAQLVNKLFVTDGVNNVQSWDGAAWMDEGNGATDPPICKYLISHTSRLFAAGHATNRDTLYVSDILDGGTWGIANTLRVGGGEGEEITGICRWSNFFLVVGKRASTYVINADPQASVANWTVELVHANVGCVSHRTMQQVGQDVWFLSRQGVVSVRRLTESNNREIVTTISEAIGDVIERINWNHAHKSTAFFHGNKYFLSVPLDDATEPDTLLVYDTRFQAWFGFWTGWNAAAFARSAFSSAQRLVFGDTVGNVREWLDYIANFKDDAAEIETEWLSRAYLFGDPISSKTGFHSELEFYESDTDARFWVVLDELDQQELTYKTTNKFNVSVTSTRLPVDLPFVLAEQKPKRIALDLQRFGTFRSIQIRMRTERGLVSLRSSKVSAFLETIDSELKPQEAA